MKVIHKLRRTWLLIAYQIYAWFISVRIHMTMKRWRTEQPNRNSHEHYQLDPDHHKTWTMELRHVSLSAIRSSFRRFNVPLYLTLLGRLLVPTIYASTRVYILGSLPDGRVISVISQLMWVTIIMEVMEEGLLMPLYHCFGKTVAQQDADDELKVKVRSGFYVCLIFYAVFCAVIAIFTPQLIDIMGLKSDLGDETAKYIRLQLVALFVKGISKLFGIVLLIKGSSLYLNLLLVVQLLCAIVSDTFFFSNLNISLKLGSKGVAYSSIIQSIVTSCTTFVMAKLCLNQPVLELITPQRSDFAWLKLWSTQGFYSGVDSLIRNSVYLVVVIRGMNLLEEQDLYWIANNFIWGWLLLPVMALSELLRQDVATSHPKERYRVIIPAYICIALVIVSLWFLTSPGWYWFVETVLNAKDPKAGVITRLVMQLMAGYLFFIVSSLNGSIFYAKGEIQFLCVSASAASIFLVSLFLPVIFNIVPSSLQVIAGIFSLNMVLGSMVSSILLRYMVGKSDYLKRNADLELKLCET